MSNKNLLNESTVRRFMKLAEIEPLAGNFVNESFNEAEELEELGMGAPSEPVYQDDDPGEEAPEMAPEEDFGGEELEMDLEPEPELDALDDGPGEEVAAGELTLTDEEAEVFLKVADKVRDAMDLAPEPEDVDAPEMGGDELELDTGLEEPVPELGVGEEEDELAEVFDDERLVNEVAARVAKRLLTKNKK